jgi:hypothetical protein
MRNLSSILLTVLAAFLLVVPGCGKSSKSASSSSRSGASQSHFKTPWQDECQFIVHSVITDVAEMAFFAKHNALPNTDQFSVSVEEKPDSGIDSPTYSIQISLDRSVPPIKRDLAVNGPIWSPEVYGDVTKAVFEAAGISSAGLVKPEPEDISLCSALTNLTAKTLEEQNLALSRSLENQFANPVLHERAAFLLGAFLLRDSSGDFFEIRSPLCRLCAHLTFARQLAGQSAPGINGKLANAILLTMMTNQKAALDALSELNAADPALQPWLRALRARNTHDYRTLAALKEPSLLEKVELFRARCESIGTDLPWSKLSAKEKQSIIDFPRVANARKYSVESGHELVAVSVALEFNEIDQVYSLSHGSRLRKEKLTEELNVPPERCFSQGSNASVVVIGWGQWAYFAQRHLCHALEQNFDFLQNKWGVPEEAAKFSQGMESLLSKLTLYPFVRRFNCTELGDYRRAVDEGLAVTVRTPHLVSAQIWNYMCYRPSFAERYLPNPNPHVNEWHKHNPPPGTAYDLVPRIDHPSLVSRGDYVSMLQKLHETAPYDCNISTELVRKKYGDKPTFEQMEQVYHPVLEYDSYKIADLAATLVDKPQEYEAQMLKAAAIDSFRYYNLSEYLQKRNQDEKAAAYLEKAMSLHPDAVTAASYSPWLIKYYQRKGMTSKAMQLADQAAEVYSYSGLLAKAELLESLGKYSDAWEYFLKLEERYNNSEDLMAFIVRYKAKTHNTRYDGELQSRMKNLFPNGLEKVSLKDFSGAPRDGVIIDEENQLVKDAGLGRGDIIVALYGIRTHNFQQYSYARETTTNAEMDLIVWQQNNYVQIKASPPDHRFNADFASYPKH